MKTGVDPRMLVKLSSSCIGNWTGPSKSSSENSLSKDSGGGASTWGSGAKKGSSALVLSLNRDHKRSDSVDMANRLQVVICGSRVKR